MFLVSGFGFRVSSFELWVSGFEIQISGLGFRGRVESFTFDERVVLHRVIGVLWFVLCVS